MRDLDLIENIDDAGTLRQIIRLQYREIERLTERLKELTRKLAAAEGQDETKALQLELLRVEEQLARLQSEVFSPSSERRGRSESGHDNKSKPPRRGHGPREQPNLIRVEVPVHELGADERQCPECKGDLEAMGGQTEDYEEITVVRRKYVIEKHRRQKYRCRCNEKIVTAPGPVRLMAGGHYSIDFAVDVAVDKYLDHSPLERQVRAMKRDGLVIDSQTLWDQLDALAKPCTATYRALRTEILSSDIIPGVDETTWRLMKKGESKRWYVWTLYGAWAVYHQIAATRSADEAKALLEGYEGCIMCDDYSAYRSLAKKTKGGIRLAHCWSHARRRFFDARPAYPTECDVALDWIDQLFLIERRVPDPDRLEGADRASALALRHELRQRESRPIVDSIFPWAKQQVPIPKSGLDNAVGYLLGIEEGLRVFLDDPSVPLSNNGTERVIRPITVGRKNHYGSRSIRGTQVAAIFYSLLESAVLNGVDPRGYLTAVALGGRERPGYVLLPWEYEDTG